MKKLLLATVAVVSLTACSRNNGADEITPEPVSPIVGTWKYVRTEIISGVDGSTLNTRVPDECGSKNTLEFRVDGKHIDKEFIKIGGQCTQDGDEESRYDYNPATKILKLTYSDGSVEQEEVLLLDATNLHILPEEYDYNRDGVDDKVIMFYVRQN
jgi:lipoprotein